MHYKKYFKEFLIINYPKFLRAWLSKVSKEKKSEISQRFINMCLVFKDSHLQKQFEKEGFVVLPLLKAEDIKQFKRLADDILPIEWEYIYTNVSNGKSYETNVRVHQLIEQVLSPHIESLLNDYKLINGMIMAKGSGPKSEGTIHQDYNSVDEKQFCALSFWFSLIDTNDENECLQVIKESHNAFNTIRSHSVPPLNMNFDDELDAYLTSLLMKVGDVCIYDPSLFHGSKPNYSNRTRIAYNSTAIPLEAQWLYYNGITKETFSLISAYKVDSEFLYNFYDYYMDIRQVTNLEKTNMPEVKYQQVTRPEVLDRMSDILGMQSGVKI